MGTKTIALARAFGFRFDERRDAYVLRGVGNRMGPVLRTAPPVDRAAEVMAWPDRLGDRRRGADRRRVSRHVEHDRRTGLDRRRPLAA